MPANLHVNDDARSACQGLGGDLLSIESSEGQSTNNLYSFTFSMMWSKFHECACEDARHKTDRERDGRNWQLQLMLLAIPGLPAVADGILVHGTTLC